MCFVKIDDLKHKIASYLVSVVFFLRFFRRFVWSAFYCSPKYLEWVLKLGLNRLTN